MVGLPSIKDMLSDLITTPSISSANPDLDTSNYEIINVLANWLSDLRFEVDVFKVPGRPGKYNLVATFGEGSDGLIFSGHSDTVPIDQDLWVTNPFVLTESDGKWFGLGACDMKGFFPVVLEAINSFNLKKLHRPISVIVTADEECGMWGARALQEQGNISAAYAVVGEPTGLRPIRAHKGVMFESVRLHGSSGHSSNPEIGNNAIDSLVEVINELKGLRDHWKLNYASEIFDVKSPTMNFGLVKGGDNPNRICGQAELQFDVRPVPGMAVCDTRKEIFAKIERVAERYEQRFDYLPLFEGVPPFEEARDSKLISFCEKITGVQASSASFATEAPFFHKLGIQTVVLGPGYIEQAHQPNEFMPMSHISPAVRMAQQLVEEFCF